MVKKSASEKASALLETIATAKKKLEKLQQQQKIEIGTLAIKYNLHSLSDKDLEEAFKKIANEAKLGK